jgi:hypothetical protein
MVEMAHQPMALSARWIAPPGPVSDNYTFLVRRAFDVAAPPARAVLHITAETRYAVYLNGSLVGQGPARGTDKRFFVDSYDVAGRLRAGVNHLAVRVHCPVAGLTSRARPAGPGVLVQLESLVATDATWQTRVDPAHRADAPLYTHHIGYSELRDLRREPVGWETGADGDDQWHAAVELADAAAFDGRGLDPRPILPLTNELLLPAAVIDHGCVPNHYPDVDDDVDYATLMQMEMHYHLSHQCFSNSEALLAGEPVTVTRVPSLLPNQRGEGAYLLLDWEREVCGNLVLDVEGPEGTIIDVGYDEAVDRGRIDTRRVNPNGTVYRFADRYILRGGRQQIDTRLHDRGMRVMQLVVRRFDAPVTIHRVAMVNQIYPTPQRATFECDLPWFDRLVSMCADTIEACSLDVIVDCPWREQTLWIDDLMEEARFWLCLTNDGRYTAHNLRVCADGVLPSGMFPARYPSIPNSLLPVTSANWITALRDHWYHTGDTQLVQELLPTADRALKLYASWRTDEGLVPDQQGEHVWNFIDWGYGDRLGGTTAPLNMIIAAAFRQGAELHRAAGDAAIAAEYDATAGQIIEAILRKFWLPDQQHLYDCTAPKVAGRTFSQLPHAVGVYGDLLDGDYRRAALNTLLDPQAIRAEYGYQLLVLDALVQNGYARDALRHIEELWGHIARSDSKTVWEVFDGRASMTGCGSVCHAYGAYPLMFAHTAVLGVRPLTPGFATFALVPQSLGIRRAAGSIPTPHGMIEVERVVESNDAMRLTVAVPTGTTAVLADGRRLEAGRHDVKLDAAAHTPINSTS